MEKPENPPWYRKNDLKDSEENDCNVDHDSCNEKDYSPECEWWPNEDIVPDGPNCNESVSKWCKEEIPNSISCIDPNIIVKAYNKRSKQSNCIDVQESPSDEGHESKPYVHWN